jgi:hypothetical protein
MIEFRDAALWFARHGYVVVAPVRPGYAFLGSGWRPLDVHFTYPAPRNRATYRQGIEARRAGATTHPFSCFGALC